MNARSAILVAVGVGLAGCVQPCPNGVIEGDLDVVRGELSLNGKAIGRATAQALAGCRRVEGSVTLIGNAGDDRVFDDIEEVTGVVTFAGYDVVPFHGFKSLQRTEWISFWDGGGESRNAGPSVIGGFDSLVEAGAIEVRSDFTREITAFQNLRKTRGITIDAHVHRFSGFAKLEEIGSLQLIAPLDEMPEFALPSLVRLTTHIEVQGVTLNAFALPALEETSAPLFFVGAASSFEARRLRTSGSLTLPTGLRSIALPALTSIEGDFVLARSHIDDLAGIPALRVVAGDVDLYANDALCPAVVDAWLTRITVGGTIYVRSNGGGGGC